jgi:hypothetical protein
MDILYTGESINITAPKLILIYHRKLNFFTNQEISAFTPAALVKMTTGGLTGIIATTP